MGSVSEGEREGGRGREGGRMGRGTKMKVNY